MILTELYNETVQTELQSGFGATVLFNRRLAL